MSTQALGQDAGTRRVGRTPGQILLAGTVTVLLIGVVGFDLARDARAMAQRTVVTTEGLLAEARNHEQLARRNRALLAVYEKVQERAQASLVLPRNWSERKIDLRQQSLERDRLNSLLVSTARNSNQLLKLEEFDLAVTHPDEDLFSVVAAARNPLMVSLRGTLNFRISD